MTRVHSPYLPEGFEVYKDGADYLVVDTIRQTSLRVSDQVGVKHMKPPKLPMPDVPAEKMSAWRAECEKLLPLGSPGLDEQKFTAGMAGCWLAWQLDSSDCEEKVIEEMCMSLGQWSAAAIDIENPWDIALHLLAQWRLTRIYPRPGLELADALIQKYGIPDGD